MSENKTAVSGSFRDKVRNLSDTNLLLTITVVAFFLMYIGAVVFQGEGFLKPQSFFNILNSQAALIVLACGLTLVMINGSIDISVGGVTALVSMCCAVYLDFHGGNLVVSLLIALGIGLAFGLFQGFLVAYLDIQPFIVTLAGMFFARGMTTIVNTKPFNVAHEGFNELKMTRVKIPGLGSTNRIGVYVDAYVEIGVVVAILIVIALFCVLRWTKLGRSFYAVGGNKQSALMLGINVKRTKFIAHLMCGLLAGIGGYIYFLHVGSGSATHAVGGTMLTGGVGNIVGTLFGVMSLGTIQNIVASAGLDEAWWIGITRAAMLCLFLVIQSLVIARKKKSRG